MAIDSGGNFIIGAGSKLLRVTPSGAVSTLAQAPGDAFWTAVAFDAHGDLIVADRRKPVIWRVSPDGLSVVKVATYDALEGPERPVGVAVEASGDYVLVVSDVDMVLPGLPWATRVYRISPAGVSREVRLRGVRSKRFSRGVVIDTDGGLLIGDFGEPAILRVAKDGEVTRWAPLPDQCEVWGLARDSVTGHILAASPFCARVLRANPDGSIVDTWAPGQFVVPIAIVVDPGK